MTSSVQAQLAILLESKTTITSILMQPLRRKLRKIMKNMHRKWTMSPEKSLTKVKTPLMLTKKHSLMITITKIEKRQIYNHRSFIHLKKLLQKKRSIMSLKLKKQLRSQISEEKKPLIVRSIIYLTITLK